MSIIKFDTEVRNIVTDYDALSERCDEFDLTKKNTEAQSIVVALKRVMKEHPEMTGLSANQLGFNKRIIVLNFNGELRSFVNPIIEHAEGLELSRETCHSEPGRTFLRLRHSKIRITYQTPLAKIQSVELVGMAARVMQHHMDHLDGLLLSDVSLEIDDEFDNATEEEKQEIINMYLEALDLQKEEVNVAIQEDPEAKQMYDAIRFIQGVQSGEVQIEHMPLSDEQVAIIEEYKESLKEENKT